MALFRYCNVKFQGADSIILIIFHEYSQQIVICMRISIYCSRMTECGFFAVKWRAVYSAHGVGLAAMSKHINNILKTHFKCF